VIGSGLVCLKGVIWSESKPINTRTIGCFPIYNTYGSLRHLAEARRGIALIEPRSMNFVL
jgi:hypothetical protein